ncbi:MAG: hypothetical protein P1U40_06645 [Coxiellaceae bacterium]|nr:hypothetical protein [Coxiellaceae bacterium]
MKTKKTLTRLFPAIVLASVASFGMAYAAGFPPPPGNETHTSVINKTSVVLPIHSQAAHLTALVKNPTSVAINGTAEIVDDGNAYFPAAFTTTIGTGANACVASVGLNSVVITKNVNPATAGYTCSVSNGQIVLKAYR